MQVHTRPRTTPHPVRVLRQRVGRVMSPRREREPNVIVRVCLSAYRSTLYAYRCDGPAKIGDMVEVDTPLKGVMVVQVVALGRGGYEGPLKTAKLVR